MGGKNSKVKSGKKGKSKSKNGELDGLSAPEGKYEEGKYEDQATLPRPELNLDGNSVNVGDNAKLEIMAEGDTSIPNAEVDLETGDFSAISDNMKNTAQAAESSAHNTANQVSTAVSKNAEDLAEKSDNVVEESGRMSGELQKSAEVALDHAVEASGNASDSVNRNIDGFVQMSDDAMEESGRISGDFQTSAGAATGHAIEVSDVSSSISQNMDEIKQDSNQAVEATGRISSELGVSAHTAADEAFAASQEASASLSRDADAFSERANANVNAADTALEEGRRAAEETAHEIASESRNSVSSFMVKRDEVSQSAAVSISDVETNTDRNTRALSENIDGVIEAGDVGLVYAQDFTSETGAAGIAAANSVSASAFSSSQESTGEVPDAQFVKAYDEFMAGSLRQFLAKSSELGGEVAEMGQLTKACFDTQRDFLVMASKSKEPSMAELPPLLAPLSKRIEAVTNYTESHRTSKAFNNLSAVSSGIGALGWVSVTPTPGPFVKDMMDSSLFYSNKVLKEFRGVNETQVEWCKSLTGIFNELMAYIKQYHTTGVSWNPQGGVASVPSSSSSAPSAGGPPPPAPPPPPPAPADGGSAPKSGGSDDRSALFASLNKGADITKGLKKVTDEMKTHKNPSLRQGPAPFKPNKTPSPISAPKTKSAPVVAAKPPKLELEGGKKWRVEYQEGNQGIQITETSMKQVVYIFKCTQSSVVVKGKVNSVVVDSCKKVGVVVDDVISSIEFVNCQSVQGQILGTAPTVSIDKTDGCMVYLSKDSIQANIVTAKSSEMNILVPVGGGDFKEYPLPEQFKTTWNGKELVTEATDIAG